MDHQCGSTIAENGILRCPKRQVRVSNNHVLGFAIVIDDEIRYVSRVWTLRVIKAMLLAFRIEMRAGGFEVRGIAPGILVNMQGMLTGRQIVNIQFDLDPLCRPFQVSAAHLFATSILQFDFRGVSQQRQGK